MRFSRRTVWAAMATVMAVGLVVIVGVGVGIVKLWPVAAVWTQNVVKGSDLDAARRLVAQIGVQLGDGRIQQLSRTGAGPALLAALTGNPQLAELLKWTAAIPALGPLVLNGAYQKALEEAIRQNVPNLAQIRLDQVAAPEMRALLGEVQQAIASNPQGAEAASAVNANVLNVLKSETFSRLLQDPDFARFLAGTEPTRETQ